MRIESMPNEYKGWVADHHGGNGQGRWPMLVADRAARPWQRRGTYAVPGLAGMPSRRETHAAFPRGSGKPMIASLANVAPRKALPGPA
jgi:hypothetical protein